VSTTKDPLTYVLAHEGWWARSTGDAARPRVIISGPGWNFTVERVDLGQHGEAIQVTTFSDAFAAFSQLPQFFTMISEREAETLDAVVLILKELGAVDATPRTRPEV
jgi:hypothetical protein